MTRPFSATPPKELRAMREDLTAWQQSQFARNNPDQAAEIERQISEVDAEIAHREAEGVTL